MTKPPIHIELMLDFGVLSGIETILFRTNERQIMIKQSKLHFKIAFLISFFWHLFWICSVSITFAPGSFKLRRYSSVSFLGSILSSPVSIRRVALVEQKHLVEFPAEAAIGSGIGHFNKTPFASLPTQKALLRAEGLVEVDLPKEPAVSLASFVQAGPRLGRKIIFQPALPEYPEH